MPVHHKTLKIQSNKGKHRIWMQGRDLDNAGFIARAAYSTDIGEDRVILKLDPNGTRNVSGKDKSDDYREPVIDLHQKDLSKFVQDATHVDLALDSDAGTITIRRAEKVALAKAA